MIDSPFPATTCLRDELGSAYRNLHFLEVGADIASTGVEKCTLVA